MKFLIIDGNALAHRAYHALPPLRTKKGELVNVVYGFLLVLLKALKDIQPSHIAATFDVKGPTFRHEQFKQYKAKRIKAPDELYQQLDGVKEMLRVLEIPIYEKQGFEADDIIGTLVKQAARKQAHPKMETVILTGDLDCLQLVSQQTKVYTMRKGIKDTVLYGPKEVTEKYEGLTPEQMVDFRGLRGDPSDNIPGVTGIGEKTAIELLKEFGSLDNLYQEIKEESQKAQKIKPAVLQKLKDYKEQALLSRDLAQINKQAPVELNLKERQWGQYQPQVVKKALERFEFYSLVPKFLFSSQETAGLVVKNKKSAPAGAGQLSLGLALSSKAKDTEDTAEFLEEIKRLKNEGLLSDKVARLEKDLAPVVKQMEQWGVLVNKKALIDLSQDTAEQLKVLEKKIYQKAGQEFNINSPSQVSEILFDKLGISALGVKKTPGGAISTRESELLKLKNSHKVVGLILEHRELFKLKSGFVDALPKMINPADGRIHPRFHQMGTETGRMSCSEPNLQNIPIKGPLGKKMRQCFVAEKGFQLLSADYSHVELRVAAWLSGDKKMKEFLQEGLDIHTLTASQIFNLKPQQVSKEKRDFAKTLNYGIFYGMGASSLAERTGVARAQAKDFIEKYFETFTGLAQYINKAKEAARENGWAQTYFGRKRVLTEMSSQDPRLKAQAERMAVNMGPQGTAADLMKMAMVEISKEGLLDSDCRLILQIHDELLFEIKTEKLASLAKKIHHLMENVGQPQVFLAVEALAGPSWGQMQVIAG